MILQAPQADGGRAERRKEWRDSISRDLKASRRIYGHRRVEKFLALEIKSIFHRPIRAFHSLRLYAHGLVSHNGLGEKKRAA